MIQAEEDMQYCLEAAERLWRETYIEKGYGQKFDKFRIAPDPQAIAIIAVALFNRRDDK